MSKSSHIEKIIHHIGDFCIILIKIKNVIKTPMTRTKPATGCSGCLLKYTLNLPFSSFEKIGFPIVYYKM